MIGSRHVFLTIALLAPTASMLGAPPAHACSPMHVSGNKHPIQSREHFRLTNMHLPRQHQPQIQQHVEDPFADMNLG
jgi:hypothetical protein